MSVSRHVTPPKYKIKNKNKNIKEKRTQVQFGLSVYSLDQQHGLYTPTWPPVASQATVVLQGGPVQKVNHALVCFETQEGLLVGMVLQAGIPLLYLICISQYHDLPVCQFGF